jgi:hypothetical protein
MDGPACQRLLAVARLQKRRSRSSHVTRSRVRVFEMLHRRVGAVGLPAFKTWPRYLSRVSQSAHDLPETSLHHRVHGTGVLPSPGLKRGRGFPTSLFMHRIHCQDHRQRGSLDVPRTCEEYSYSSRSREVRPGPSAPDDVESDYIPGTDRVTAGSFSTPLIFRRGPGLGLRRCHRI